MLADTRVDTPPATRRRLPFASWVLLTVLAVVTAYLVRLWGSPDDDLWLHLRIGQALRDGVRFQVTPDPLVIVADQPYVPTQWLSEVVGSWVFDLAGLDGIRFLRALGIAALLAVVVTTARLWTDLARAAGVAVFAAFSTAAAWAERPQLLGLLFGAVTLLLWSGTLRDGRPRWWLVPLTWVWAMCHGSWVVGLAFGGVVLAALALERPRPPVRWPRVVALLAACAAVPALTPLGPVLWLQPFAVNATARATVNEWQPPALTNPLLVAVALAAVVVLARSLGRRPVDLPSILLAVVGLALAAYSVRTIAFGALLLSPALARALQPRDAGGVVPIGRPERWSALVALGVFLAVPGVVWATNTSRPLGPSVDDALANLPAGTRIAVDVRVSGWVLWAHPQVRPLRDLRAEIYSPAAAAGYERLASAGHGWQTYAQSQGMAAALTDTSGPLAKALGSDAGWHRGVDDGTWVVWVRTGGAG